MTPEEIVRFLRPFTSRLTHEAAVEIYHWLTSRVGSHPIIDRLHRVSGAILNDGEVSTDEIEDLRTRIEAAVASLESNGKSTRDKDYQGQPIHIPARNLVRNYEKTFDQFSGICLGILADGNVSETEALAFRRWADEYAQANPGWPFDIVRERVEQIYRDGVATAEEREDLAAIMRQIIGQPENEPLSKGRSSSLPVDDPSPDVHFVGRNFVPTGKFAFGTRRKVEEAISSRGGMFADSMPTLSSDYLVIGEFVSRDWINTQYGRKIERAVELRAKTGRIAIIPEKHFVRFL